MLEAPVLAAMVSASASLIGKAIEWASKRDEKAASQAKEVVDEAYDQLRTQLTDNCVRVLKLLESGQYEALFAIRQHLYPSLNLPPETMTAFDGEFRYRLHHMQSCGTVTLAVGSDYGITRIGQAFLEEARRRRDYYKVLFGG